LLGMCSPTFTSSRFRFPPLASERRTPDDSGFVSTHHTQALRDDPVLAPMFDYSHCIVVGNGVPGHACIFNTSALEPARLALGWLSTDGPRKSWTLKRRDENTKGEVV
jgi:hypothetical protein